MASSTIHEQTKPKHTPVLLNEVLSFFPPIEKGVYLDGTLGLGGHSEALLQAAENDSKSITLIGLDQDTIALELAQQRLEKFNTAFVAVHSRFSEFETALEQTGHTALQGALIDIGVSSMQLDEADRGFSFATEGPLDMRMNQSSGEPAAALINRLSVAKLKDIIFTYGEEPMAGRIARAIDDARAQRKITTTTELAAIVADAYPAKWKAKARNHPATRTFQALRMVVNNELEELRIFLEKIIPYITPGGRIAVITFHSLEDRIVKHFFRDKAKGCDCPRHISKCICHKKPELSVLTKKPLSATGEELQSNPRASSAKLRVAEKLFPNGVK